MQNALNVLVVEDDVDSREMLCEIVSSLGHRPLPAGDAEQAIACVSASVPDVGFVDIGLPGSDGCVLARRLRQHSNCSRLYLVALTGYGNPEDEAATQAAGFNEHLLKPLSLDHVRRVLATRAEKA
jgi:two-component system, chemotaxis family, CheB/CheR fusion protein